MMETIEELRMEVSRLMDDVDRISRENSRLREEVDRLEYLNQENRRLIDYQDVAISKLHVTIVSKEREIERLQAPC